MNRLLSGMLIACLALVAGCTQEPPPPDTRPQDEAAIRKASRDALAAVQAKDADKMASFYTNDAVAMFSDAPAVTGKEQIRQTFATLFQDPNFSLTWSTTNVEVAKSGDIAWETGTYEETASDAKKKPVKSMGHYVVTLKKQGDGSWKIVHDIGHREPAPAK